MIIFGYSLGFWYLMSFVFSFCITMSAYDYMKKDEVIPSEASMLISTFICSFIPVINMVSSIFLFKLARICHKNLEERKFYKETFKEFFWKEH